MEITAIEPQKRKRDRVNIFINEKFSFSLDHETLLKQRLSIGQELTQAEITKITTEGNFAYWYNRGMQFLSYRPRSTREVHDYLKKKKLDAIVIQRIVTKLTEKKFLDDTAFAQWFIAQRTTFRPKGKKSLTVELRAKGVANDTIESVLVTEEIDEVALAQKIAVKKLSSLKRFPKEKQKEKLTAFLYRRGFTWNTIQQVLSLTKLAVSQYTID